MKKTVKKAVKKPVKRKVGRPEVEHNGKKYMECTTAWQVRLWNDDLEALKETIDRLSKKQGKRIFYNTVIRDLINGWVEENKGV